MQIVPFHRTDFSAFIASARSKLGLQDATILVAALCAATLFAFEFDFFESAGQIAAQERRITVQELFGLTGLLIIGLIVFSFRRLQQQKREFARRLAAEISATESRFEARRDPLTGLPNRRALLEAIAASHLDLAGSGPARALLMLDLNGFKHINDQYGHAVGDQILETIGRRMHSIVGGTDVVARLGGDEFAVFFRSVRHRADISKIAEKLIAGIEAPIDIAGHHHCIGAGAGIALYPQDGRTEQELFRCADVALYRAKAEGRSAVKLYS